MISIVIPVYNESISIGLVINRTIQCKRDILSVIGVSDIEVIVVNDGSKDDTTQVVSKYSDIKLINLRFHSNYGKALKIGFGQAKG